MRKKGVYGYVNYHERGTCLKCLTTEIRSIKRIWDELKKRTKKKKDFKNKTKSKNKQIFETVKKLPKFMEILIFGLQELLQAMRVVIFKIEKMTFCTEKSPHNATSKPISTSNNSAMRQSQSTVSNSH